MRPKPFPHRHSQDSTPDCFDGARLEGFAGLEPGNRTRCHPGELGNVTNPKLERRSGHPGLRWDHLNDAPTRA